MKLKFDNETFDQIGEIEEIALPEEIARKFSAYTYYTIEDRALVDVIDGLKPVQRRILYSMYKSNLTPAKPHTKSARVVGDTMGNYHPHGDASIYDALVRLALPSTFSMPLIDGQGNFGAPGISAAAPRYTECRLSAFGLLMTEELADKVVDTVPNFDDTLEIPSVLPAQMPLLLINGTTGIAVAMASNMAPHNPIEAIKACIYQLDNQDQYDATLTDDPETATEATRDLVKNLMKVMPGPDFPTGGTILGIEGAEDAYTAGQGKVMIRGRYHIEPLPRGKNKIVFDQFPYGVSATTVMSQLREAEEKFITSTKILKENGGKGKIEGFQIEGILSVDDYADVENDAQLVIVSDSKTNPEIIVAELFKRTKLESSFNFNQNCLVRGAPKVISLPEMIQHFLNFRRGIVLRRSKSELEKRETRQHLVSGLLKALVDIDKAIAIIRASDTPDVAHNELMSAFSIDETQAKHILDLPLRRLTKMDALELEAERDKIIARIEELTTLIDSKEARISVVREELVSLIDRVQAQDGENGFFSARKSQIENLSMAEYAEAMTEALSQSREVSDDPCTIYLGVNGKIGRKFTDAYTSKVDTTLLGTYIVITNKGRGFRVETLDGLTAPLAPDEKVVTVAPSQGNNGIIGTKRGIVFAFQPNFPTRANEFQVINLAEDDEVIGGGTAPEGSIVSFVSSDGSLLRYGIDKVASKATLNGKGIAGIKLGEDAEAIHFSILPAEEESTATLFTSTGVSIKTTPFSEYPSKGRATGGVRSHRFLKGEDRLVSACIGTGITAFSAEGSAVKDLSPAEGRRDGSGHRLSPALVSAGLRTP